MTETKLKRERNHTMTMKEFIRANELKYQEKYEEAHEWQIIDLDDTDAIDAWINDRVLDDMTDLYRDSL